MLLKKQHQDETFLNNLEFVTAVESLRVQIQNSAYQTPDPEMAIIVYVARTDKKAKEYGWLSAESMQNGIRQALRGVPPETMARIEFEEV